MANLWVKQQLALEENDLNHFKKLLNPFKRDWMPPVTRVGLLRKSNLKKQSFDKWRAERSLTLTHTNSGVTNQHEQRTKAYELEGVCEKTVFCHGIKSHIKHSVVEGGLAWRGSKDMRQTLHNFNAFWTTQLLNSTLNIPPPLTLCTPGALESMLKYCPYTCTHNNYSQSQEEKNTLFLTVIQI